MARTRSGGLVRWAAGFAAFTTVALLAVGPTRAANLLTNGSFETGPAPGVATFLPAGSTALPGWVVTGAGIDYVGTRWTPVHGARSLGLNGAQAGGIQQTIPTIPLARYTAWFWLTGDPLSTPEIKTMRVAAANKSADFSADITGMWEWDPGWNIYSWSFIAVAPTTTLNFTSLMAGDTGPALDSVFVALVSTSGVPVEPNAGVALSAPSPNPSRQISRVTFTLNEAAPVRLSVQDVSGREVARLAEGTYAAGNHEASWDGRGPDGPAPAGLYFLALRVNGGKPLLQRMMRVR